MFEATPGSYDLLNRLLTLKLDGRWRRRAAGLCLADDPARVLDLCCGTGDLALQLARLSGGQTEIVGLDFSAGMLAEARKKAARSDFAQALRFVEGNAAAIDFPDGHFDAAGIAFALRNLTWHNPLGERALAEALRVLRPGGRLVAVETSQPPSAILRAGFHAYMKMVAGPLGGLISRQRGAYRYLSKSARNFYDAEQVQSMLTNAGFDPVRIVRLAGGLAAAWVAFKPADYRSHDR